MSKADGPIGGAVSNLGAELASGVGAIIDDAVDGSVGDLGSAAGDVADKAVNAAGKIVSDK